MTRTTATSLTILFCLSASMPAWAEDDWDGGFETEPEAAVAQIQRWKLAIEGSLLAEAFTYMERTPSTDASAARYAADARLVLKAENANTTAHTTLLVRRDYADASRERTDIEQAYIDVGRGTSRLRLGRTLLDWGSANIYEPADLLNPIDYTDFLRSEKRGSFAAWGRTRVAGLFLDLYYLPIPEPHIAPMPTAVDGEGNMLSSNRWVLGQLPVEMGGVPVSYTFEPSQTRAPSLRNAQGAVRVRGSLANVELSLGYAYMFDQVPLLVPYASMSSGGIAVSLRPEYRRNHVLAFSAARAFGETRLAMDTVLVVPRDLPAGRPAVETDDGRITGVLSVDHRTKEFRDNHRIQLALDVTLTEPLSGELPRDNLSRLRYPFLFAAMGRISYHAGTDLRGHFTVIQSLEGFGGFRLDSAGDRFDALIQPELEMTLSNYVEIQLGATFLVGSDRSLLGQYSHNSRVYWSAETKF